MYQVADTNILARGGRALVGRGTRVHVSRTVILLGLTSLLHGHLPRRWSRRSCRCYLIYSLGLSPLQFGVIDGIQQGASSLVRVVAGFTADRWGRYEEVAVFGYGLSAFCRDRFLLVGRAWGLIGFVVFLDRTGKGIRTAPRDAMISLSTLTENLGVAFGVHRALDTAGAVLGPPHRLRPVARAAPRRGTISIFVLSFCFRSGRTRDPRPLRPEAHRAGRAPPDRAGRADHDALDRAAARGAARFGALLVAGGVLALSDDERRLRSTSACSGTSASPGGTPPLLLRLHVARVHAPRRA